MSFDEIEHIAYNRIGHNQIKYAVAYYIKTRSPRVFVFLYLLLTFDLLGLFTFDDLCLPSIKSKKVVYNDDTHSIFSERQIKWKSRHKNIIIGNVGMNVEMCGDEAADYKKRLYLVERRL